MSDKEYYKNLRQSEARHRYWHIYKDELNIFPPSGVPFKLEFDGKTYELKVNHKNDIMTGQLYERYRFLEGDKIIVKKKNDKVYVLDAPDTKLYPRIK